jgi:hypothetical protein
MLLSVDAWVMTHEHIMERPCPIAWTGQVGAEGTDHHTLGASQHPGDNPAQPLLSELEKEEIRMRLRHPFSVLSGPAYWGGFCLMLFALQVAEHSGTAGTLTFAAACTILWVAALLRLALAARRFKADAEDGTLDVHGDRLVLRHSRKVWSVAGKPAQWRLRGAPTDA